MKALAGVAAAALLALASGCGSVSTADLNGHILVVDPSGAPLRGAVIFPDYEYSSSQRQYSKEDVEAFSTNAQGMVDMSLDDFLWDKDGCYHFRVQRAGYETSTMSVSRDLLPPLLKVTMSPVANPVAKAPAQGR